MTISVAMIVKDEEHRIARALSSVTALADEIVVVDTGSADQTGKIAESMGALVYYRPWPGDFAKARNYAISLCTGDWILTLDADEEIPEPEKVRELANTTTAEAVQFRIVNHLYDGSVGLGYQPRLFKNNGRIAYVAGKGGEHNRLDGFETLDDTNPDLVHHGYNLSPDEWRKKGEQRIPMMRASVEADPHNPWCRLNLCRYLRAVEDWDGALREALAAVDFAATPHLKIQAYWQVGDLYRRRGQLDDALEALLDASNIDPLAPDPLYDLGNVYGELKCWEPSIRAFAAYLYAMAWPTSRFSYAIAEYHRSKEKVAEAECAIAYAYHQLGYGATSVRHLHQASLVDPENEYAKKALEAIPEDVKERRGAPA